MATAPEETPEYLIERIRRSFAEDPRLNELELQVNVIDDRVVVTGRVQTEDRRQAVTQVLRELVPDRRVENLTKLLDTATDAEVETLS
jgi:BON domain